MNRLVVVGDGAVGIAVAVALSEQYHVVLAGPPGIDASRERFQVTGLFQGVCELEHVPIHKIEQKMTVVSALKSYDIKRATEFISRFALGEPICLSNGLKLDKEWGIEIQNVEYAVLTAGFLRGSPTEVSVSHGHLFCTPGGTAQNCFDPSPIEVKTTDKIDDVRWAKWYTNSIVNPIGALTGLPNNLLRSSSLGHILGKLQEELLQLAPSMEASQLGLEMLHWILENSTNRAACFRTSRLVDRQRLNT